jgi:hypothetical protein
MLAHKNPIKFSVYELPHDTTPLFLPQLRRLDCAAVKTDRKEQNEVLRDFVKSSEIKADYSLCKAISDCG